MCKTYSMYNTTMPNEIMSKWYEMAYFGNGTDDEIAQCIEIFPINKSINYGLFSKRAHPFNALEIAVFNGRYGYVRKLLNAGCNVSVRAVKLADHLCLCGKKTKNNVYSAMFYELAFHLSFDKYDKYNHRHHFKYVVKKEKQMSPANIMSTSYQQKIKLLMLNLKEASVLFDKYRYQYYINGGLNIPYFVKIGLHN